MLVLLLWTWLGALSWVARADVAWNTIPFNPPAYPLAVRSPYLNIWLSAGPNDGHLARWPKYFTGSIAGWAGFIRVDGEAYTFMGEFPATHRATQKSATFTATQSIFVLQAGPIDLTATFLSPIEPNDLVKQSMPFSYLALSVQTNDGNSHNVQIYTDISGEFISSAVNLNETWATTETNDYIVHSLNLVNRTAFVEEKDRIHDGVAYHTTLKTATTTWQSGADTLLRPWFQQTGRLNNTQDGAFRAIADRWPVFAFAHDLGSVTASASPIVTVVGHDRDPLIRYLDGKSERMRHSYWRTEYSTVELAIEAFLKDYPRASSTAKAFDKSLNDDASKISADYANILALSARQVFGGLEITVGKNSSGAFDRHDLMVFMKEISSGGNIQSIDVLYASLPAFIYMSPAIGQALLEPILRRELNGANNRPFCVHDLGLYPNATGYFGADMPIETTADMLIMALAYAQASHSNAQLEKYYDVFDKWATYLVTSTLRPDAQLSSDDFAGVVALQTNLALKGIIGIASMVKIAGLLNRPFQGKPWGNVVQTYADQWMSNARSPDMTHITLTYGDPTSWTTLYNLYADRLVKTDVFEKTSLAAMQTQWYQSVATQFGVPLDSRSTWAKSDWMMFAAATVTDVTVRDMFISKLVTFLIVGMSAVPFPDLYDAVTGEAKSFVARPAVGGHFAFLPLTANAGSDGSQTVPEASRPDGSNPSSASSLIPSPYTLSALLLSLYLHLRF